VLVGYRQARANRFNHKKPAKAREEREGKHKLSHPPRTPSITPVSGPDGWCHPATATELLLPVRQARLWFPCPVLSQRS